MEIDYFLCIVCVIDCIFFGYFYDVYNEVRNFDMYIYILEFIIIYLFFFYDFFN